MARRAAASVFPLTCAQDTSTQSGRVAAEGLTCGTRAISYLRTDKEPYTHIYIYRAKAATRPPEEDHRPEDSSGELTLRV